MDPSLILSIVISSVGAFVSWLISDVKSKSKILYMDEKVLAMRQELDILDKIAFERIAVLEIKLAKFEEHREELHRLVTRLDNQKASKDVVDGFRSEITTLRVDMDKRFDRIERLFQETKQGYNS